MNLILIYLGGMVAIGLVASALILAVFRHEAAKVVEDSRSVSNPVQFEKVVAHDSTDPSPHLQVVVWEHRS